MKKPIKMLFLFFGNGMKKMWWFTYTKTRADQCCTVTVVTIWQYIIMPGTDGE